MNAPGLPTNWTFIPDEPTHEDYRLAELAFVAERATREIAAQEADALLIYHVAACGCGPRRRAAASCVVQLYCAVGLRLRLDLDNARQRLVPYSDGRFYYPRMKKVTNFTGKKRL